jgi:arylsulfatase A-like enzyme
VTHTARSLVLVTIDCLRADRAGFLGYSGATTPLLDSLSKESFVFQNALATGVPTYYSLPALLASRYPLALGRDVVGIAPGENTIATELRAYGFKTAAFIAANPYISATHGYDSGFDTFNNFLRGDVVEFAVETEHGPPSAAGSRANRLMSKACHTLPMLGAVYDEVYFQYCARTRSSGCESLDSLRRFPSADVIVDCAIAWLNENSAGPFFLWIHLMDPHAPYYPKSEALSEGCERLNYAHAKYLNSYWARGDLSLKRLQTKKPDILSLYDAGIRWADLQIGRLVQKLRELKVWDQCAVAITADHGEEFLDHGGRFHSPLALHEELVHVPLLLHVPEYSQRCDIDSPVGLIDLAPTLLDVLGLSIPASFRGRSCWRKLTDGVTWEYPVITECVYGCSNPFQAERRSAPRLLAIRSGNYKLILNFASGIDQLFDLSSDPGEVSPLPVGSAGGVRSNLLQCARKHIQETALSGDLDLRIAAQLMELRQRWANSVSSRVN